MPVPEVAPEKTANKSADPKKKDAAKKGAKGAKDAKNLTDPDWQASIADAIAEGIEQFFDGMEN